MWRQAVNLPAESPKTSRAKQPLNCGYHRTAPDAAHLSDPAQQSNNLIDVAFVVLVL
jgi:hypothetical protein